MSPLTDPFSSNPFMQEANPQGARTNDWGWLQVLPDAACIVDADTKRFLDVNSRLVRWSGWSSRELVGIDVGSILFPLNGDVFETVWHPDPSLGQMELASAQMQRRDLQLMPLRFVASPLTLGNQNVFLFTFRPPEDKWEERWSLVERVVLRSSFAIAFWNPNGSFHHANPAFERLLGSLPKPGYNLFADRQLHKGGFIRRLRRALKGETVQVDRLNYDPSLLPGSNATTRPICVHATLIPIVRASGEVIQIISLHQDMTSQCEAEMARDKLESRLIDAQKLEAIGTLAGGVAHDFNNLLTGIIGYIEVAQSLAGKEAEPFLIEAEVLTQRCSDLTRQLLAYARKSRNETCLHDMNITAREVTALIRQTVDRRIKVDSTLCTEGAIVNADPGQMSQVILNLCVNARDAILERTKGKVDDDKDRITGGWQPCIKIETRHFHVSKEYCRRHPEAREGDHIRVTVRDNGVGMDDATRIRVFEPFFTTKAIGKGTGLGLATLFGIVKQHQGWVDVRSEVNRGTAFHVYLPAVSSYTLPAPAPSMSVPFSSLVGGTETVLFVDDEESIRDLGKDVLGKRGYTVLLAMDGRAALDVFENEYHRVDLVILDLTMPRLSGWQVLPRLHEIKPGIKVITTSGYAIDDTPNESPKAAASAFLQKPYASNDLVQLVRRVLDK